MQASLASQLQQAFHGKKVLVTGHTGFKGGWLTLWLQRLGAHVTGFALAPPTAPALFTAADVARVCTHVQGDICDYAAFYEALQAAQPDYIFHLAAQPLVRLSYTIPISTLETNVMGTAHVLEAVRKRARPCVVIVVTSDKCYANREWDFGYRECDAMGGHDIYAMSKGAAELVVASYRKSFFPQAELAKHGVALGSVRSGNVVGGGDWAADRLIPDAIRLLTAQQTVVLRNPRAVRPWQHVLEPLGGYLLLAARLAGIGTDARQTFCDAWNFGPLVEAAPRYVEDVVAAVIAAWGQGAYRTQVDPHAVHEATLLRLCIDKANIHLGWAPRWSFSEMIDATVQWYRTYYATSTPQPADMTTLCYKQIHSYMHGPEAP